MGPLEGFKEVTIIRPRFVMRAKLYEREILSVSGYAALVEPLELDNVRVTCGPNVEYFDLCDPNVFYVEEPEDLWQVLLHGQ